MASKFANLALILIIAPWSIASAQTIDGFLDSSAVYFTLKEESPLTFDRIPSTFPNLDLPAHFIFETATLQHGEQTIILNTQSERPETLQQLTRILESANFLDFHSIAGRELYNFIVTERTRYSRSYCRDDVGYLTFTIEKSSTDTRITLKNLGHVAYGVFTSCLDEANREHNFELTGTQVRRWMQDAPVLNIPDAAIVTRNPRTGDTLTSNQSYETDIEFKLNISIEQLYAMLEKQILVQGWTLDNQSSSHINSNSNWLKKFENKPTLLASISITQRSNAVYIISLRTTQLDADSP